MIKDRVNNYNTTNTDGTIMLQSFVHNNVYNENSDLVKKLAFYRLAYKFYDNEHWAKNNEKLLSFNYIRAIINKVNEFTIGRNGFEVNIENIYGDAVEEEVEKAMEANVNFIWNAHNKRKILGEILQMGGVTGDCYVLVYLDVKNYRPGIKILDSRYTVPIFSPGSQTEVIGYRFVEILKNHSKKYVQKVTEYTDEKTITYFVEKVGSSDRFELEEAENLFSINPVVHIENMVNSFGYGGNSDAIDILKLNKIYNEAAEDVRTVIDYYGTPVTVITGAVVSDLKRGVGEVWSGLPQGSTVANLNLDADLNSNFRYLETIRQAIHDLTGVPQEVLSKVQHISNTSSAALKMLYHSLVMAADRKITTYSEGIAEINKRINIYSVVFVTTNPMAKKFYGTLAAAGKVSNVADYRTVPVFEYGFPNDRMVQLQEITLELNGKIGSRREAMEKLGKKNIPKILAEIDEDVEFMKNAQPEMGVQQPQIGVAQETL